MIPFTQVLNSSPELEGLKGWEKANSKWKNRDVTAQTGHGIPARLGRVSMVLESCHLDEEHESLALVLLDVAPLWFYTVIWEGFTQVLSVRRFCQPQCGSLLSL